MAQLRTKKSFLSQTATVLVSMVALMLGTHIKMSFMIGSHASFFSLNNIGAPMVGVLAGTSFGLLAMILRALARALFFGISPISFIVYHIPSICASAYWHTSKKALKIGIPLICMFLFGIHPIGGQAFGYALYWFVPVVIYVVGVRAIFWQALASTFVAHAIGSIIWLYSVPMTVAMWYGLIPLVAVERILFASGMTIVYCVAQMVCAHKMVPRMLIERLNFRKYMHESA